jgi:hypothetical protein
MQSMKAALGIILGMCLIIHQYAFAIDPSTLAKGRYNNLSYTFTSGSSSGKTLAYSLYVPATFITSAHLPLLVHMHGGGARSTYSDTVLWTGGLLLPFLRLNSNWSEATHPCVILEPLCGPSWCGPCWDSICAPAGPHIHNLNSPRPALQIIRDFIPILQKDLRLDSSRSYITGWSNGGSATWDLIMYWPDFFAAAVPLAGAGDTLHAYRELNVPVWAGASQDDDVVPFIGTKSMVDKLTALGGSPQHTYVNGWHHFSEGAILQTPELVPWLFSQVHTGSTITVPNRKFQSSNHIMIIKTNQHGTLLKLNISLMLNSKAVFSSVRLTIFNTNGRIVRKADVSLIDNKAGTIGIDLRNFQGRLLSPGKYLCRMEYGSVTEETPFIMGP